jgi:hypothetical protein
MTSLIELEEGNVESERMGTEVVSRLFQYCDLLTPIKFINYIASPLHNGLLDHDAQLLIIYDINLQLENYHIYIISNMNNYSIEEFKTRLSYESWDSTYLFIMEI